MTILTIVHGQELGWVCLASCGTDVVVNAMVLFWLTRPSYASDEPTSHGGHTGNHGPGHNRADTAKNGVVLQRISAAPGAYNHTSSYNGNSRPSTGLRSQTDIEGGPRSPMKVNFSGYPHSDVYDGSQPYVHSPSPNPSGEKFMRIPASPTSALFLKDKSSTHPPSFFTDQKRHSSGIVYERTVTTGNGDSNAPGGFLNKLMGRKAASGEYRSSSVSVPGVMTFGRMSKKKQKSEEDAGVRITITTRLEQEDDTLQLEGAGNASSSEPSRSKEDQSTPPKL